MTAETGIWNQIMKTLESKLSKSEIMTWFSQASLEKLDNHLAVIKVPNKFIASWMRDNYTNDIKASFKEVLDETPAINIKCRRKNSRTSPQKTEKIKKNRIFLKDSLDKSMKFDNYIIGEHNRFAYTSALEVSKRPGYHYNPLYIFSRSSLGKTHLLNAIGNYILERDKTVSVGYVYSKSFISDFNNSLRNRATYKFREKYYNLDVLLFDDVHYLSNRNKIQEEFLNIFNLILGEKKQIVITCDRPPNRLKNINSQLKSRLGWGLLTEITGIDYENKINILKNKIKDRNINIPNDIISLLVKSSNDLKILLKNIIRIEAYISLNNGDINLSIAKSLIKDRSNRDIGIKDIQNIISSYFNISVSELISDKKKRLYSYPRHLAMYLTRKYTDMSFLEIGYQFGNRDHSTVIYAIKKIEKEKSKITSTSDDLSNIENLLT